MTTPRARSPALAAGRGSHAATRFGRHGKNLPRKKTNMDMQAYEKKYAEFLDRVEGSRPPPGNMGVIVVPAPEALGETYEEIVESLKRLAHAGLLLLVMPASEQIQ